MQAPLNDFGDRLRTCMKLGHLSVADLSEWFETPYATAYTWVYHGRKPRDTYAKEVYARLSWLEKAVRSSEGGWIVPFGVSLRNRREQLRKVRDAVSERVPVRRPAS